MRLPRVRLRTLMIAVAVVAVGMVVRKEVLRLAPMVERRRAEAANSAGWERRCGALLRTLETEADKADKEAATYRSMQVPEDLAPDDVRYFATMVWAIGENPRELRDLFERHATIAEEYAAVVRGNAASVRGHADEAAVRRRMYQRAAWIPWLPEPDDQPFPPRHWWDESSPKAPNIPAGRP